MDQFDVDYLAKKLVNLRLFDGLVMTEVECFAEKSLNKTTIKVEDKFQFEKYGFYCVDINSDSSDKLIFNETVKLRSSY